MINIEVKEKCSGCWACYNVCPKRCIKMEEDSEGFHYPHVDKENCIECGLCEKVCPLLAPKLEDSSEPDSYVVQHRDGDVLRHSTSGGFFTALSEYVIRNGGVVFGASFDENMVLRHTYGETLEACKRFRGSKYVQSLIGDSYREAKGFLDEGRIVAFSGTPCQIAGLVGYLGKRKYERLILVDLVCRGTPSPRVLKEYLSHHAARLKAEPMGWLSRDKYYGYDLSTATIVFNNIGSAYHRIKGEDFMLTAYFNGLISRPSCYNCHFKTLHRQSDLTLFDCWDAKATSHAFSEDGATNVLVHTDRGEAVFSHIKESFLCAKSNLKQIVDRDGVMIYHDPPISPCRVSFFEDLNNGSSIPELSKKYLRAGVVRSQLLRLKPLLYRVGFWCLYMRFKRRMCFPNGFGNFHRSGQTPLSLVSKKE